MTTAYELTNLSVANLFKSKLPGEITRGKQLFDIMAMSLNICYYKFIDLNFVAKCNT